MNKLFTKAAALTLVFAVTAAALPSVSHAGGVIGDLINQVAPGVGTQLDQLNHDMGQPVEKLIGTAVETLLGG